MLHCWGQDANDLRRKKTKQRSVKMDGSGDMEEGFDLLNFEGETQN